MKMKMKNKRIVKSTCLFAALLLAVLFGTSGCDEIFNITVPSWARGNWSINPPGIILNQVTAVEITSKEFIPRDEFSKISFLSDIVEKKEVTLVTLDTVIFDLITVEKGPSNQIKVGILGKGDITLYRKQQ